MSVERTQEFHLGFSRTNLHVLHRTSATEATCSWMRIFLKQDSFFARIGLILSTQITSKSGKRDCVVLKALSQERFEASSTGIQIN